MLRNAGFTLLELLVVLVIIGLLAGYVAPSFSRLADRTSHSVSRNAVLAEFDGLAYRVYLDGRPFKLTAETAAQPLQDGRPALALPEGWKIELSAPVEFSPSGVCAGGEAWLSDPDGARERLTLVPPACHLADSNA